MQQAEKELVKWGLASGHQDERSEQDSCAGILLDAWKLIDPLQYVAKSDNFTLDCFIVEISKKCQEICITQ